MKKSQINTFLNNQSIQLYNILTNGNYDSGIASGVVG